MAKQQRGRQRLRTAGRVAAVIAGFLLAAAGGAVTGVLLARAPNLPQIEELDSYRPGTITRIYARGGEPIGEFATERRVIIGYTDIPEVLRNAIVAAEDGDFFNHVGIDVPRIVVTLVRNIVKGDLTDAGASTITMQLARNITLSSGRLGLEKRWERKLREVYYAFHIEKRYTKREILTLYANQMWLGTTTHSAHGVEAASRLYFGKSARDLTLGEAATIAGIHQAPSRKSPLVNMELARDRRDYALQRMADEGFISQEAADATMAEPIVLADRTAPRNTVAPYFVEEIRQHLEAEYGVSQLYERGLTVHTTLDAHLQAAATMAVEEGLREYDRRQGYRAPARNILDEGGDPADPETRLQTFRHHRWSLSMQAGDVVPAVVTTADAEAMQVRFGPYSARVVPRGLRVLPSGRTAGIRGIGRTPANDLVRPGDLIQVRIRELETRDAEGRPLDAPHVEADLDQEPVAEAALIAIDNRTGRILAMVGGLDFNRSKFNRATQARRQMGSLFKGVLYAAAIDQGYTATSLLRDELISYDVGPEQPLYRPENYNQKYDGIVTLRRALELSKNAPSVQLIQLVGPSTVVDFARRLGFTADIPPFLSVALGAAEATLLEVTSAYSAFPNRGRRMIPYRIERIADHTGTVLEEHTPQPQDAVRPDTAYIIVSLMRGVVERGTGRGLLGLEWPIGGKTGTVDDYTDAWFVGFDTDISVGVWVGHDEKITLGDEEEGARVALPIWRAFMRAYSDGQTAPAPWTPPANIVFTAIDPLTGKPTNPEAADALEEAFIAGTEPGATFTR